MQGELVPELFDPERYALQHHPGVEVIETDRLPGRVLGCVDHVKGIIWLARGLSEVERRCTLAFELGQLEQGPTPVDPFLAAAHQRSAEDWATRMLIPAECLFSGFRLSRELPVIAAFLQVDLPMLRARMRAMTDEEQDAAMAAIADSVSA